MTMQIMIEIPDEKYERLAYIDILSLRAYIENGKRLPKGHGRLIDENYLLDLLKCEKYETCDWRNCTECREEHCIKKHHVLAAPTILEADKEMLQIVINISEDDYQLYRDANAKDGSFAKMIAEGVPLPKGHGRLIDVDDLDITTITTDDYSGNEVLDVVLKEDVDDAETIVEADKE
jgi:hypothetical protein